MSAALTQGARAAVPLILTAILLWIVSYSVDLSSVIQQLSTIDVRLLILASLLMLGSMAIATSRYQSVIAAFTPEAHGRFAVLMKLNLFTLFTTHFLPAGALADGLRAIATRRLLQISGAAATESVIADRGLAALGIAALGLVLLPVQIAREWPWSVISAQALAFSGLLIIVVLCGLASFCFPTQLGPFARVGQRFIGFIDTPRRIGWQLLLSAGTVALFTAMLFVIATGLRLNLPLWVALSISPAIYLSQVIPIFYAGFGSREVVVASLLVAGGTLDSANAAVSLSLCIGICNLIASIPGALFAWPLLRAWLERSAEAISDETDLVNKR